MHCYCRGTVGGIEQIVVGDGGADTVEYNSRNVDPALQMNYPSATMDASDIEIGYLVMRLDERAGKVQGVQKLWNRNMGKWVTGDILH